MNFKISEIINGEFPGEKEIERRKKSFAVVFIDNKGFYFSGDDAIAYQDFLDAKVDHGKEISGVIASSPVDEIVGTARIVKNHKDFSAVKNGDIIVATMTTPDFVPIMQKAVAFVTDEGGILCHAAILSREMKKPCIVGTKNATKMIKDGDRIRMNLKKGMVKIVPSNS